MKKNVGLAAVLGSVVVSLALWQGCSDAARTARRYTYPPDFAYVERTAIRTAMGRLAASVNALNEILRQESLSEADRQNIVGLLAQMEAAARDLEAPAQRTNHPMLDTKLPAFQRDVELALRAARDEPPNYFLAGAVAGSCFYCHERGR